MDWALEMLGVSKAFPGVQALDNVDLRVKPGEIHAIVGENGAGKSTLMKVLSGAYTMDSGRIRLRDADAIIDSPLSSQQQGIGIIYQHLNLVPDLSVEENIFLGRLPAQFGRLDIARLHAGAQKALADLAPEINPKTLLRKLSLADQQLVAVAKALSQNASIIIMDEPTSSLTPAEVERLFSLARRLRDGGASVIFISHHMDEIFAITDRVTVLRDGKLVGAWNTKDLTEESLVGHMVGRLVKDLFPKADAPIGETVLEVENLSSPGEFENVSFKVRSGEILGIAGLVGAGRTEVVKAIFGDIPHTGSIRINGKAATIGKPSDAVRAGFAFIPEDRGGEGLVLPFSVRENITLPRLREFVAGMSLSRRKECEEAEKYSARLRIKTPSLEQTVNNLSGGNQQKVALAKWFGTNPRVLLLDEPTRGIDVGAKAEIYRLTGELASRGVAVVMVSSELPELLAVSDRIIVMCRGKLAAEFVRGQWTSEKIMLAAAGGRVA